MSSDSPSQTEEEFEAGNPPEGQGPQCTCVQDPYAELPPELRPKPQNRMGGLRKVTCPGCGLVYWTNRKTDLCVNCEKKGVKIPQTETSSGGG